MLKTFDLELISLVSSYPSRKVSKGSRGASRRARRTVCDSLKNCRGLVSISPEASDMPVSESERGASILDCRFSEKAEYIPIKKRRFLLRCSPPPSSPPPTEESTNRTKNDVLNKLVAVESASSEIKMSTIIDNTICTHDKKSEKAGNFFDKEDFSGIDILAAAACSSSLGRESSYAVDGSFVQESSIQGRAHDVSAVTEAPSSSRGLLKEDIVNSSEMSSGRTSSCVSTEPIVELASILTIVNSSQNVTTAESSKCVSLKVDSLISSGDGSCHKDKETVGTQKMCHRDERLHWDLNVAMDVWEHPFESPKGQNDVPVSLSDKLAATSVEHNFVLPGEPRTLADENLEENKVKISQSIKPLLSNCSTNFDGVKSTGKDSKSICYNRDITSTDRLLGTASNPATHPFASVTMNENNDVSVHSLKLNDDGDLKGRLILERLNLTAGGSYFPLEYPNTCASVAVQPCHSVSSCADVSREVISNLAALGSMKTSSELQYNGNAAAEKNALKTGEPLEHLNVVSDGNSLPCSVRVDVPNSTYTRCELSLASDAEVQCEGNMQGESLECCNDTLRDVSEISLLSKETCDSVSPDTTLAKLDKSFICSGKTEAAKALDRNDDADVFLCPLSSVREDAINELPQDIDSQYEDGELREPKLHPWEGYDGMDREAEHVDYEPDEMDTAIDCHVSESGQIEDGENLGPGVATVVSSSVCKVVNEIGGGPAYPVEDGGAHEQDKKVVLNYASGEKMKTSWSKELSEGRGASSDMDIALSDDNGGKDVSASHPETNMELKPFRRGLQSRIEGPVTHDSSSQERRNRMVFRYEESRDMRSFQRPQYSFHNQGRGRQGDTWNNFPGNRRGGFRRHYSPIIHRHVKLDDDAVMGRDVGYVGVQDDGSYSHQLCPRSQSGADEDDYTGLHSRYKPNRGFSPGRPSTFGRGRSIRYGSFVDDRAGRGRYNGPSSDESFQFSLNYRRPLSRRERSVSPFGGRAHSNAHHSRANSPSQSRSRSPVLWNSLRGRLGAAVSGRGAFVRQRSRSPNFRTEVRMQRLRSAHHQSDFGANNAMGFRSIPRNHGSPPYGRWSSAGKEEIEHFREFAYKQRTSGLERSPGRIRSRGDRTSVLDSPRNIKPDGYYRVSEDSTSRGLRYEDNYEGRSKNYTLRPARRSYDDGVPGR